jgi:hypothetical protein
MPSARASTRSHRQHPGPLPLKGWKYGFQSPFKADVYFVNTRLFTGNKWGTSNPIMMRDKDFGIVRLRAFGTYDFRVVDVPLFLKEVAGSDHDFRLDEFADTMRSASSASSRKPWPPPMCPCSTSPPATRELGEALLPIINPAISVKYGIEITSFISKTSASRPRSRPPSTSAPACPSSATSTTT